MCLNLLGLCTASVILMILIFMNNISDWLLFTSKAATIMVSGASLGEMVIAFVVGQSFRFNHLTLVYAATGLSIIETIIFRLLNF